MPSQENIPILTRMEDKTSPVELLFKKTESFIRSGAGLYKLKIIDKSAEWISTLTARFVAMVLILLFFLTINMAVALWIGDVLGKVYWGFFVVAGFYALMTTLVIVFQKTWIKEPVKNAVIIQALK
ncbi:MAG: hypothetical protein K0S32_4391 [Bacteroidetes bacterium]|nr:hypothetical protein [Bacteroidota bacterium]